jgi:hypothetical protein
MGMRAGTVDWFPRKSQVAICADQTGYGASELADLVGVGV